MAELATENTENTENAENTKNTCTENERTDSGTITRRFEDGIEHCLYQCSCEHANSVGCHGQSVWRASSRIVAGRRADSNRAWSRFYTNVRANTRIDLERNGSVRRERTNSNRVTR